MSYKSDPPRVWWSDVTGPHSVIEGIADALSDLEPVALVLPEDSPWPLEMRACAEERIRNGYGLEEMAVEIIDDGGVNPVEYLLGRFARSEAVRHYRSSFDPHTYLKEHEVLKCKVVWIEVGNANELNAWADFVSKWKPSSTSDGLFVVETSKRIASTEGILFSRLHEIDYGSCTSSYSISLFNGSLVSERIGKGCGTTEKRYLAALLTHVCGSDVEVSAALSEQLEDFGADPIGKAEEVEHSFDGARGVTDESNILTLCRRGDEARIARRIWEAQVEVLFPLIETLRLSIIEDLSCELTALLGDEGLCNHGEKPSCIEDIELGSLVYLMAAQKLEVCDYERRKEIHLLRACRNHLAHRKPCPWDDVRALLNLAC